MPFHPPFARRYRDGDLVYGLHEIRDRYADTVDAFAGSKTPENISTIDQYAATATEREVQRRKPKYQDDFHSTLKSHKKYAHVYNEMGFAIGGKAYDDDAHIRRKIKGGLHWAAQSWKRGSEAFGSEDRASRIYVHFVLDSLNLEQVANKSHERDATENNKKYRSFTGVELRWIYRNRADPDVQSCVQFWLNGEPTSPPWTQEFKSRHGLDYDIEELWSQYQPRSAVSGLT